MRRSPQLQQGEGAGVSNRPGNRAAAGPAALSVPRTPHHPKSGAALNDLVRSLDKNWRLGLEACGGQRSPAHNRTIADKTYSTIQRLFYSARPALDEIIERFNLSAPGFAYEKRLELLLGLLKSQTLTPSSRGGTPSGATNANPKNVPCKCKTLLDAGGNHVRDRYPTRGLVYQHSVELAEYFMSPQVAAFSCSPPTWHCAIYSTHVFLTNTNEPRAELRERQTRFSFDGMTQIPTTPQRQSLARPQTRMSRRSHQRRLQDRCPDAPRQALPHPQDRTRGRGPPTVRAMQERH
jgi:hypothetical protein